MIRLVGDVEIEVRVTTTKGEGHSRYLSQISADREIPLAGKCHPNTHLGAPEPEMNFCRDRFLLQYEVRSRKTVLNQHASSF